MSGTISNNNSKAYAIMNTSYETTWLDSKMIVPHHQGRLFRPLRMKDPCDMSVSSEHSINHMAHGP